MQFLSICCFALQLPFRHSSTAVTQAIRAMSSAAATIITAIMVITAGDIRWLPGSVTTISVAFSSRTPLVGVSSNATCSDVDGVVL